MGSCWSWPHSADADSSGLDLLLKRPAVAGTAAPTRALHTLAVQVHSYPKEPLDHADNLLGSDHKEHCGNTLVVPVGNSGFAADSRQARRDILGVGGCASCVVEHGGNRRRRIRGLDR